MSRFLERITGRQDQKRRPKQEHFYRNPVISPEMEAYLTTLDLYVKEVAETCGFTAEYRFGIEPPSWAAYHEDILSRTVGLRVDDRRFSAHFSLKKINALSTVNAEILEWTTPPIRYTHTFEHLSPAPNKLFHSYNFARLVGKDRPALSVEEAESLIRDLARSQYDPGTTQELWEDTTRPEKVLGFDKYWNQGKQLTLPPGFETFEK
jgi:hypothetical protein